MDLKKRAQSRVSIWVDETLSANTEPLHTRVSLIADFQKGDEKNSEVASLLEERKHGKGRISISSNVDISTKPRKQSTHSLAGASYYSEHIDIDISALLQLITQQTADQLALIVGKTVPIKTKLYNYQAPVERFEKEPEYSLEVDVPTKTYEQKMLKIQGWIKKKIDEMVLFVNNILKDTSDELKNCEKFTTLFEAMENIYATESDDYTILNMKAEETCAQLFHDIKRIEKEIDKLLLANRAIHFGYITEKDKIIFLTLKQQNYIQKWEASRQALNRYIGTKACNEASTYINLMHDKILKDQRVSFQICKYLHMHIDVIILILTLRYCVLYSCDFKELRKGRDQFPDKLDIEVERRSRIIAQMREELEEMQIHRKGLAAEIKKRTQQMHDWLIYRAAKEARDAELARIAEEEEQARIAEEERIAAELAAEEEYLATLTDKEKALYMKEKRKKERKAAKAAKKAAKLARKRARRTA